MTTLKELASTISYDSSWGIWAELIDGKFTADSKACFGQRQFENGGLLDEFKFFANGETIGDSISEYCDDDDDFKDEAVSELIDSVNESLSDRLEMQAII
jgi:hypothetical protein